MTSARSHVLRLLALLIIGLLPAGGHAATLTAVQESGAAEPIVVLDEAGVELSVVGSAMVQLDDAGEMYLTLERITIGEGVTFGPLASASPELIVMEAGALQQQDERGFWARMEAPYQMALAPDDHVEWGAASETSLLRVQLTDAMPDDIAFEGVTVERVAQFRLDAVAGPVQLFIAQASVTGRSGGARFEHDGSVGIAVESGAIDLLSPSGLEGTLAEGQSVLYPDGAPIEFLGARDDQPANALLVGVTGPDHTLGASATIGCRPLDNTCTQPGSSLAAGETWYAPTASLAVELAQFQNLVRLGFTYTNTGDAAADVAFDRSMISVTHDTGIEWDLDRTNCIDGNTASPQSSVSCSAHFGPPSGTERGSMVLTIHVAGFGDVQDARWQAEIDW